MRASEAMDLFQTIEQEVQALRRLRDELRSTAYQIHMDAWQQLEAQWPRFEKRLADLEAIPPTKRHRVESQARELLRELRDLYHRIREELRRNVPDEP